jgi:hypothetical protein
MIINRIFSNLSYAIEKYRLILWILLLLLTASILIFPVNLQFEYHPVESLYIFGDNLLLFSILYVVWLASLLLLLFSKIAEWQRVVLITIFTLVFLGFWVVNTPYGSYADGMVNMGHVKYLTETGNIQFDHPVLAYFQFPGMHLTALSLSEITGLDIFWVRIIFILFLRVLFAILLYLFFSRTLNNKTLASLSVILLIQGSIMLSRTEFHPSDMAFIFFGIILFTVFVINKYRSVPMMSIFIISFAGLIMTYLAIPVFIIFILGGIYLLQKISKKNTISWTLLIFCIVIFLTWEMYWATRMFYGLAGHTQDLIAAFSDPIERLLPIFGTASSKLGESVPLWASLTRFFWMAVIFVLGMVLGVRNIFRIRKLDSTETLETGGLWGVLIFSVIGVFAFPGGTQIHRILMYAPLFTVPIIMRFLNSYEKPQTDYIPAHHNLLTRSSNWLGKYSVILLMVIFFVLSLPTFLVNRSDINTQTIYKYELSAGEFVENNFDDNSLLFISDILTIYTNTYYVPDASLSHPPQPWEVSGEEDFWLALDRITENFTNSTTMSLFTLTEKFDKPYSSLFNITQDDPKWLGFTHKLTENNMIYSNNHTQIYQHQPLKAY